MQRRKHQSACAGGPVLCHDVAWLQEQLTAHMALLPRSTRTGHVGKSVSKLEDGVRIAQTHLLANRESDHIEELKGGG